MSQKFTAEVVGSISLSVDTNAAGNIAQDGETVAGQKNFTWNIVNSQELLTGTMGQNPSVVHSEIESFLNDIWTEIFLTTYDDLSVKSKIEFTTEDI